MIETWNLIDLIIIVQYLRLEGITQFSSSPGLFKALDLHVLAFQVHD